MVKNYFKVAYRNLIKNPLSSFINVLGLSAGVACCLIAYTYLYMEFTMEAQHTRKERIFMVTNLVDRDGKPEWYGITPTPIGIQLKEDFPQISHLARVDDRNVVVQKDANTFHEWTRMVDPDYLDMFDFKLIKGNRASLDDRNNVIITREMAEKYFGDDDPMGQTINMRFAGNQKIPLKVSGVADVEETKTSFNFNFLTNFELLERADPDFGFSDWGRNISSTLIMLDNPADIETLKSRSDSYAAISETGKSDWKITDYDFEPVSTIYDRSANIRWDISRQADVEGHLVLSVIAFLLLLLACLNYLNIAITSAVKRLKEIGIRKVIGANRGRLVGQFMAENVLLSAIALIMGLLIGVFLFLPGINNLFGITMGVEVLTFEFLSFIIGLLAITAIMSGAYPALYISKFQVVSIFKGNTSFGRKNVLSKIFLTLEFVIASIAVSCGVIFTMNTNYQQNLEWGYDQKELVMMKFDETEDLEQMKVALSKMTSVESFAASNNHLGQSVPTSIVEFPDRKVEARRLDVDEDYLKTVGFEMLSGDPIEAFDKNLVLINENFQKQMEWENAEGQTFRYDSMQYTVKGVVRDFHYFSFWNEIQPVFIRIAKEDQLRYLVAKTDESNTIALYEELETTWAGLYPDEPFSGEYQTQLFADYFRNINGHRVLMTWVAGIALLMTCLGLYGLIGLNISGRIREFSIRKVLGASRLALSKAVSSHFALFLIIALLIGVPISYLLVSSLLNMIYEYPMPLNFVPVIGAMLLIVVTIVLTIVSHLYGLIKKNPTEGLRVE